MRVRGVEAVLALGCIGGCADEAPGSAPAVPVVVGEGGASSSSSVTVGAGGGGGGAPELPPDGSWEAPFVVSTLPATITGDTVDGAPRADAYWPCAPETDEAGGELVYAVDVPEAGWLDVRSDDVPGDTVDVDLHLLAAADPATCITRHDSWLGSPVQPGRYWLVVDSWVDGEGMPRPGPFELELSLVTQGTDACLESPIACDGMLPPYVNWDVAEAPGDAGCPDGMARVEGFCIDRHEAFVIELTGDGWAPLSPYAHPPSTATLMAVSVAGATPQGHISQIQASEACLMAGKRLCDDAEWLRACRGPDGETFPYGDSLEPGTCNDARACHPVVQYFESGESWIWSELGHPCISQLPEGLAATGDHPGCGTADGVFDLVGNLHEWTSDPAGTFRGGFYVDTAINGQGCSYATTAHSVGHHDYSTGFRCCADAN